MGANYENVWDYDAVGNRTKTTARRQDVAGVAQSWAHTTVVTSQFNDNDQLTSQTSVVDNASTVTQNYSYDANGAEKTVANKSGATNTGSSVNGWDFEGKLRTTQAKDAEGDDNGGSSNAFDAQGDRLWHVADVGKPSQKTTSYVVDTDTSYSQVVEESSHDEKDSAGVSRLQARYVWGQGLAPLAMWRRGGDGAFKLFYFVSDGQESVRQLTDSSGEVTDSYFYDAWGKGLLGGSGNTANPFRYTGQQLDSDGRYYLRARFYDPGNGRFLSHDPLMGRDSDPVSMHRYLYGGVDGINAVDPSGLYYSYRQELGYLSEAAAQGLYRRDPAYRQDVSTGRVLFGQPTLEGDDPLLKPDIFNKAKSHWMDVKPWSWSGINDAVTSWNEYDANFRPLGYSANTSFLSIPAVVPVQTNPDYTKGVTFGINTHVMLFNIKGIIFWKELRRTRSDSEMAAMEAAISAVQSANSLRDAANLLKEGDDFEVTPPPSKAEEDARILAWGSAFGAVAVGNGIYTIAVVLQGASNLASTTASAVNTYQLESEVATATLLEVA